MPGVGAIVGSAAGSCAGVAVAVLGLLEFWAKPAGGAAGCAGAGAVTAGVLAGACAAAGVSQAAANAIAHPIRLISTPGNMLEPETQVRASLRCGLYRLGF